MALPEASPENITKVRAIIRLIAKTCEDDIKKAPDFREFPGFVTNESIKTTTLASLNSFLRKYLLLLLNRLKQLKDSLAPALKRFDGIVGENESPVLLNIIAQDIFGVEQENLLQTLEGEIDYLSKLSTELESKKDTIFDYDAISKKTTLLTKIIYNTEQKKEKGLFGKTITLLDFALNLDEKHLQALAQQSQWTNLTEQIDSSFKTLLALTLPGDIFLATSQSEVTQSLISEASKKLLEITPSSGIRGEQRLYKHIIKKNEELSIKLSTQTAILQLYELLINFHHAKIKLEEIAKLPTVKAIDQFKLFEYPNISQLEALKEKLQEIPNSEAIIEQIENLQRQIAPLFRKLQDQLDLPSARKRQLAELIQQYLDFCNSCRKYNLANLEVIDSFEKTIKIDISQLLNEQTILELEKLKRLPENLRQLFGQLAKVISAKQQELNSSLQEFLPKVGESYSPEQLKQAFSLHQDAKNLKQDQEKLSLFAQVFSITIDEKNQQTLKINLAKLESFFSQKLPSGANLIYSLLPHCRAADRRTTWEKLLPLLETGSQKEILNVILEDRLSSMTPQELIGFFSGIALENTLAQKLICHYLGKFIVSADTDTKTVFTFLKNLRSAELVKIIYPLLANRPDLMGIIDLLAHEEKSETFFRFDTVAPKIIQCYFENTKEKERKIVTGLLSAFLTTISQQQLLILQDENGHYNFYESDKDGNKTPIAAEDVRLAPTIAAFTTFITSYFDAIGYPPEIQKIYQLLLNAKQDLILKSLLQSLGTDPKLISEIMEIRKNSTAPDCQQKIIEKIKLLVRNATSAESLIIKTFLDQFDVSGKPIIASREQIIASIQKYSTVAGLAKESIPKIADKIIAIISLPNFLDPSILLDTLRTIANRVICPPITDFSSEDLLSFQPSDTTNFQAYSPLVTQENIQQAIFYLSKKESSAVYKYFHLGTQVTLTSKDLEDAAVKKLCTEKNFENLTPAMKEIIINIIAQEFLKKYATQLAALIQSMGVTSDDKQKNYPPALYAAVIKNPELLRPALTTCGASHEQLGAALEWFTQQRSVQETRQRAPGNTAPLYATFSTGGTPAQQPINQNQFSYTPPQ